MYIYVLSCILYFNKNLTKKISKKCWGKDGWVWGVISVTLFKHALPIFPSSACITHNWPTLTQTSRGD